MQSRNVLVTIALAAFAMLVIATTIAGAAAQPPEAAMQLAPQAAPSTPEPEKLAPGTGSPGVYVARDWRTIDPTVYPVVGGHDSFTWKELEPTSQGSYDWSRLDAFIAAQAALGKKAAFGISTYNGRIPAQGGLAVPDWFALAHPADGVINCGGGVIIPRYWSTAYQTAYGSFVQQLANHIGINGNVAYAQIGVGLYGETQPADDMDDTCVKNAMNTDFGFTTDPQRSAKWVETVNQITARWNTAFAGRQRLFIVYTPRFIDPCEKQQITSYAANLGVGLFAGGIYADTLSVFSTPPGGQGCQKWDPIVFWNGVTTKTIPVALETYRYMLPDYDTFYWGMLSGLNKHADYLSLESDLLYRNGHPWEPITENFDMIRFANRYLGKTPATAPNAWVALRETSPAHNGYGCNKPFFYPQYGDYDYYLYHDDTVAGGRTITASTTMTYLITADSGCPGAGSVANNPQYDALLDGKGPQGWITRRTDHAGGNDYMYFRVDDAFLTGQSIATGALMTVTYFDHGSDSLYLQYKAAGGADRQQLIAKTNTNQWKTAPLAVPDIDFSNANRFDNGNDFRIYNGGDGDEYIHLVQVGKYRAIGPTATPTRTSTPSPTATATPVTVVFQEGVSPSPAYQGVIDTYISNYGDPDSNYGISPTLHLRTDDAKAILIRFDVSSIPQGAYVLSATVNLSTYSIGNGNPLTVKSYRMLRNWTELGATWNMATASIPWSVPGANGPGDRFDVASDTEVLSAVGEWYDFDVTDQVRGWVASPGQNFGVALKTTAGPDVDYGLWSSDYTFAPTSRPRLIVVYAPSYPGPTPTPTVTRTRTPSLTPTRTATPTPATLVFQQGVSPFSTYSGVMDTFISNYGDVTANYGLSPTLELRSGDVRAALLRFSLATVPSTAQIINASISVHVDYKTNDFSMPVSLYRVLRPWNDLQATWLKATSSTNWAVPGANGGSDRSTTATSSVTMASANAWYDFDVTSLVQQWVSNPGSNMGVALKAGTGPSVAYGLRSSEYFSAPSYRPKLTITCRNCQGYRIELPVILSSFPASP